MEWIISLCLGVALSACAGFRVFVPLLVACLAQRIGWMDTSPGFEWMSTFPALMLFATATILEIGAYYIPWLDNALDTIATPLAFAAGTVLTTSVVDVDVPALKWGLGLIAGGGAAGLIQAGTSMLRLGSSTTTGGLGNPVVSTTENLLSFGLSFMAILVPLLTAVLVIALLAFVGWVIATRGMKFVRKINGSPRTPSAS
ncbi:DUF4126 domain-containing protein [Tellurirhabdus rosea]|uniref:DUF4126 domain-containing protein n=1 Tax=Tellurirhabdus rosea TaxID=2674997 RepID=UPI002252A6A3|nr:DUF4126 domain-containing protein [Tellurirhabdus rosea]